MKTKTFFFTLLLIATSCMLSAQNLEGTWKAVESSGNPVREGYTTLKFITSTHFIWTMSDKDGNIISGAGGTYTLKDGIYTETILYTLPGMKNWKGKSAVYEVKTEGKRMSISGYLEFDQDRKVQNSENWERVE
ncbi:hypothetical protein [uncultured Proteiniphilum sp.]|uniref:hypothetical protein n=1 Tax=uncultured Proteiniphilum sp. TaxID=497637 RepID=UPI00262BF586|nr:hypothetical protein [uncultured Proteiniphilum sp.]